MKTLRPVLFFVSLLLIVGLACSFGTGSGNPAAPPTQQLPTQEPPTTAPTETPPQPTAVPPTEAPPPTETPPQAEQFFTEEFDNPLSGDWSTLTVTTDAPLWIHPDPDKVTVEARDGRLVWDFDGQEYVYYYLFYSAFDYEDVRVDLRADNRGRNNNNISLICRYDPEVGWYEFNIANNGLYNIFFAEVTSSGKINYNFIANGGSNAIKQGKDVNEYSAICKGTELTLYINGDEANSVTENKYGLHSGQVGMSVSSFDVLPILIEMDWVKISEP